MLTMTRIVDLAGEMIAKDSDNNMQCRLRAALLFYKAEATGASEAVTVITVPCPF